MLNDKATARQFAFEYLRRLSEELSPAEYLKKFEELESEFNELIRSNSGNQLNICDFLSRLCPKCRNNNHIK